MDFYLEEALPVDPRKIERCDSPIVKGCQFLSASHIYSQTQKLCLGCFLHDDEIGAETCAAHIETVRCLVGDHEAKVSKKVSLFVQVGLAETQIR